MSTHDFLNDLAEFDKTPESRGYDLRVDLASLIVRHLNKLGWTQRRLAEAASMKEPLVTRLIHSDTNWTADTAGRILFALGIRAKLIEIDESAPKGIHPSVAEPANATFKIIQGTPHGKAEIKQYSAPTTATIEGGGYSGGGTTRVA